MSHITCCFCTWYTYISLILNFLRLVSFLPTFANAFLHLYLHDLEGLQEVAKIVTIRDDNEFCISHFISNKYLHTYQVKPTFFFFFCFIIVIL